MKTTSIVLAVLAVVLGIGVLSIGTFYDIADEPTALMRAAQSDNVEEVRRLIAAGADVNERRGRSKGFGIFFVHGPSSATFGDTALLHAIAGGDLEIVRMLLDSGADPTVVDNRGHGMWDYGLRSLSGNRGDLFRFLADRFAMEPRHVDQILYQVGYLGDAPLLEFALAREHSSEAAQGAFFGAAGRADIAMMERILETMQTLPTNAIGCAMNGAHGRRREALEFLIARGADVNVDDGSLVHPLGKVILTAVPGAAATEVPNEMRELLTLLLEHGANPNQAIGGGVSGIELARHHGHEAAARLMEEWRPSSDQVIK